MGDIHIHVHSEKVVVDSPKTEIAAVAAVAEAPAGAAVSVASGEPAADAAPSAALPVKCEPFLRVVKDEVAFRACYDAAKAAGPLRTPLSIDRVVGKYLRSQDQEVFLVVGTDIRFNLRGVVEVARGQREGVRVGADDVLSAVSKMQAVRVVVCHNHPSGDPAPSPADIKLLKTLRKALSPYDNVEIVDHLVFGSREVYSIEAKAPFTVEVEAAV